MVHRTASEGYRVLIVAPFGRDAESVAKLLGDEGYDAKTFGSLQKLAVAIDDHAGVVLLTEEALRDDDTALKEVLRRQPPWSDLPFVLLTARRHQPARAADALRVQFIEVATNVIILERPLSTASLISALAVAMRARQRQFQMRDRLNERDVARHDLERREAQLRLATEAAEIGLWDVDPINDILYWPPRVKAMFGISAEVPVSMRDFYGGLHPEDMATTAASFEAAVDPVRRSLYDVEYRTIGKEDGIIRWVAAKGRGLFDENDMCIRVIGTAIDITRRKADELELRALNLTLEQRVAERTEGLMKAEEALRQAQKMEAVGQLTGGIAHDFNNMLTGVIGSLDVMKRRIASGRTADLQRFMDAASQSANRAASLTSRLLAFSRRQSLDLRPIDANALMSSLEVLLRRTVSENVRLHIVAQAGPQFAIADQNQLENAILNLSINARDAMPNGGDLTIETSVKQLDAAYANDHPDAKPGRYVVVSVKDTGVGMPEDVLNKAFEPFFTTKPIGQGTGLGLSMVYGFARQAGGYVEIESKVGVGTCVSIYLRAGEAPTLAEDPIGSGAPEGHGQIVLIVEDDPSVRLLVKEVLEELVYTPIEAENADQAIAYLQTSKSINLMISDVGLPGMNGRQLAEIAREQRPELPILFITGYAENAAIRADFLGTNMAMVTKPFSLDVLAAKISDMLPKELSGNGIPTLSLD